MYSPSLVATAEARLAAAYASVFPGGLTRLPAEECIERTRILNTIHVEDGTLTRRLSPDEELFILNEQLLSKIDFRYFAERYVNVNKAGQELAPLFPLWESQEIILRKMAQVEEERAAINHPDGVLVLILKGRQLGASTVSEALLVHRVVTHTNIKALIGSDTPDNSGSDGLFGMFELILENLPWWLKPGEEFHQKNRHIHFKNGSVVRTESGKSMKGGLTEEGGSKGNIGRSKTYSVIHLSEMSTWERPEQIDDSLMPAVPETPRTLMIMESTAKGRANRWHKWWQLAVRGEGRFAPVFVPWYAEKSKYRLPPPVDWSPDVETLAHAKQAEFEGPKYMGTSVHLSREQLYWYERQRRHKEQMGELYKFREEYCVAVGTRVSTNHGVIPIEEVRAGDLTESGEVTAARYTGIRPVVELLTTLGRRLVLTADHRVSLADGGFCPAGALMAGQALQTAPLLAAEGVPTVSWQPLPCYNATVTLTAQWARFLGYYMGDGYYYADEVGIAVNDEDEDTVADIRDLLTGLTGRSVTYGRQATRLRTVRVNTTAWRPLMQALGLVEYRASADTFKRKVCVPEIIWRAPKPLLAEFLRGLFEADGHAYKAVPRVALFSKYEDFVQDVQLLLGVFGLNSRIRKQYKNWPDGKRSSGYSLDIKGPDAVLFKEAIGFVSARKQGVRPPVKYKRQPWVETVKSVTPLEDPVAVYDLTIADTHVFAANGLVVHNCSTPDEAFQYSGRSIFPLAVQERIRAQARPMISALEIRSASELAQMKQRERAERVANAG